MAETIVSPGVFTRENDLSFLPQGIGAIGAAVIGPTVKGPAFVPTVIRRGFKEYQQKFGPLSSETYVPQTVREYLRNAGTVTVVRVLAGGGNKLVTGTDGLIALAVSGSKGNVLLTNFFPSKNESQVGLDQTTTSGLSTPSNSFNISFTGSGFSSTKDYSASINPTAKDYIGKVIGTNPNNSKTGANSWEATGFIYNNWKTVQSNLIAATGKESATITFGPDAGTTYVSTASLQDITLGGSGSFYVQNSDGINYTVGFTGSSGLPAPTAGLSGSFNGIDVSTVGSEGSASGTELASVAVVTFNSLTGITASATDNVVTITSDEAGSVTNISTTFSGTSTGSVLTTVEGADVSGYAGVNAASALILVSQSSDITYTSSYAEGYSQATTPWVTSGYQNGVVKNLFRFHTLADGTSTNTEYKIGITGLKEPSDIDGIEQYSTFNVQVRKYGDKDSRPVILEQFNNCTLDPFSPNYILRLIGDRYAAYNVDFGKVITYGDYPNLSQLVRAEVVDSVKERSYSPKLSPKGFRGVYNPVPSASLSHDLTIPSASYTTLQQIGSSYNSNAYLGWKFDDLEVDNSNYLKPLPNVLETNVFGDFNVEDYDVHPSASITWLGSLSASIDTTGTAGPTNKQLKFVLPFQGGFDGTGPGVVRKTGEYITATNMQGMNLSSTNVPGYSGYKKALDILANQDEYDINMLVLPGCLKRLHASVTDAATTMAEDRGDTFYVMDLTSANDKVSTAVSEASSLDSNYAAVYYPWVKVLDTSVNRPVFVPPSVIVPGAIAASDAISAEWFAPAGLNRGVLGSVLEAKIRLNQAERDELYEGKVNPIATFPRTGVCIWGQKTLQTKPTALDRINVRRLLITVKKFIASSSKYLVFEQNTVQTRNRFLNIVNPYLESVQQRQGLYAFRVVMDETNNTPEEIDRNRLIGAIYLQPTKTAEFIVLDFNVLPTGATFDA